MLTARKEQKQQRFTTKRGNNKTFVSRVVTQTSSRFIGHSHMKRKQFRIR